jgi:LPS-assembly protein
MRLRALVLALLAPLGLLEPTGAGAADNAATAEGTEGGQRLPFAKGGASDRNQPTYVTADRVEGVADREVTAEGKAELRKGDVTIGADRLKFLSATEDVEAVGNVRIQRLGDVIRGPSLKYHLPDATGVFEKPDYSLAPRVRPGDKRENVTPVAGRGAASELVFEGEDHYRLTDATFTTCKPGIDDWYAKVGKLDLDFTRDVGTATGSTIYLFDTPIAYLPWMTFSLDNQRKSGFLPPSVGSTGKGGAEVSVPYYFNLAPNRDFTLGTRYMEKRGLQWNGQFRFLEPTTNGELRFEDLPVDHVTGKKRSAFTLNQGYSNGRVIGGLNVNKVSDDAYFRDLASRINLTSQTNLVREGFLGYSNSWWGDGSYSIVGRVQRFQTLQDPSNIVLTPYARTPQVTLSAVRQDYHGVDVNFTSEYVDFSHPTQVIGRRVTMYPSLSLPLVTAGSFLTPKIGVHSTRYQLDHVVGGALTDPTRVVPITSLDGGLIFERQAEVGGRSFVQTLEPRAFYLKVPFRDQSQIPLFDTANADFNYAQIFSENSFAGGDRIADANQLTLAVTSRLLGRQSGQEAVRATVGQRYYLADQKVTLDSTSTPRTYKTSDWLAAISGRISSYWTAETAVQYNPREQREERFTASARYQPELFKTLNMSYRYLRNQVQQIDVSAQWPLGNSGWYGIGRYNYSLRDRRVVEGLGGFEYNGDCWVARIVVQRFAVATSQATNALFIQLELNGFSRLGSNPLETLKRNIPGYSRLNQAPSANQTFDFFN